MTYEYTGSDLAVPVTLRERVLKVTGRQLEIEVFAERGSDTRTWIQVVTDTPENQRNNVVDDLFEVCEGRRERLANEGGRDLYRLYAWTLPPHFESRPTDDGRDDVAWAWGAASYACQRSRSRVSVASRSCILEVMTCADFLWTNGPAKLTCGDNDVVWEVRVRQP